ncbi:MAG: hypothetical protein KGH63_01490 [Candidatus Micrarchaeota archaeon]|nr:hypothetical protein [Candidatus Micrarchaeota archaeon]
MTIAPQPSRQLPNVQRLPSPRAYDPQRPGEPFRPASGIKSSQPVRTGDDMAYFIAKELAEQLPLVARANGMPVDRAVPFCQLNGLRQAVESVSPRVYADPWEKHEDSTMAFGFGYSVVMMLHFLDVRPDDRVLIFSDDGYATNITLQMLEGKGALASVPGRHTPDETIFWAFHRAAVKELEAWKHSRIISAEAAKITTGLGGGRQPDRFDRVLFMCAMEAVPQTLLGLLAPWARVVYPSWQDGPGGLSQATVLERSPDPRGQAQEVTYRTEFYYPFPCL